jgi:hypothetical protein
MRWRSHFRHPASLSLMALALSGCHHSDDTTVTATPATSLVGIWTGTDSASGQALTAIVTPSGAADFIRADGLQYIGTVPVPGTSITVPVTGYPEFGSTFADGSTLGAGSVTATITTTVTGTLSFSTSAGTASTSNWTLSPNDVYNTGSSLTAVSGNYNDTQSTDPSNGATVSITTAGIITAQSAVTGCVLNGQIVADDSGYDLYEISYSYASCTGNFAPLNGIVFSGVAVLFSYSSVSRTQLVIGVTDLAGGPTGYGLVTTLTLQ